MQKKKKGGRERGNKHQIGLTFVFNYTDEEALLLDDQDGRREALMKAVKELVEVEGSAEVAEAERLAEVEGLAEAEGFVEAEGLAKAKRLAEMEGLAEDRLAEVDGLVEAELQNNRIL